jgi:carboxymethylenebutenolidase
MTTTRIEQLALTDGTELRCTVAEPDNVVRGGVVVLHEAEGVTDRVRQLISALAAEGWFVAAPHLREPAVSGETILADTDAAFVWLSDQGVQGDAQGIVGVGTGGSAAFAVAAQRTIGAAVTVGGGGVLEPLTPGLPPMVEVADELTCPWLGLYGDGEESTPRAEVDKLREALDGAGKVTDVVHFTDLPGQASGEVWQRVRNWFDQHLR